MTYIHSLDVYPNPNSVANIQNSDSLAIAIDFYLMMEESFSAESNWTQVYSNVAIPSNEYINFGSSPAETAVVGAVGMVVDPGWAILMRALNIWLWGQVPWWNRIEH